MKSMTRSKLIVIWDSEDILSSSIELFLSTKLDWQVVSTSNTETLYSLITAFESTPPDIVIIHQGFHNKPAIFPLQLLHDHPTIKVILISLEDNLMDVYSKQKILVTRASDLISVIENETSPLPGSV
jgi:DNA-binding NarL/FixJ family response regulator